MAVTDERTVQRYARQHAQLIAMLKNLQEFVETMPAPDEDGNIPNVYYCYTGSVGRIHELLVQASDVAYELSDY